MNPIVRMMRRYIKTPLKYALPLLFIGALVLASTTGCTAPITVEPGHATVSNAPTGGARTSMCQFPHARCQCQLVRS
jgi:hypothetical protein